MRQLVLALVVATAPAVAAAQQPAPLAPAIAALDAAQTERADTMLRALVATLPDADRAPRARALQLLASIRWWTDQRDTAVALLRQAVITDPFLPPDTMRMHAELVSAQHEARRSVRALGARFVADTVVRPDSGRLPLAIAVGRPMRVQVRLLQGGNEITTPLTVNVDTSVSVSLSLLVRDEALPIGTYLLEVSALEGETLDRAAQLVVSREDVDTVALEQPIADSTFLPTQRRGAWSPAGVLRGLLIGGATIAIPAMLGNGDVGDGSIRSGALVIGGSVALASLIGSATGRPMVPINENIQANDQRRAEWTSRRDAAIAANERMRRFAPLRIRAVVIR